MNSRPSVHLRQVRKGNSKVLSWCLLVSGLTHHLQQFFFPSAVQVLCRVKPRRIFQFRQGLIIVAHRHQASRQRIVILRGRLKAHSFAELLLGLLERLRLKQSSSQVVMRDGGIWPQIYGGLQFLQSFFGFPGEKQRLALVRALICEPPVLLLDEPTAALDERSLSLTETLLRERLANGTSIVLVTHDPDQALRLGTQRYRMAAGKLEAA